MEFTVKSLKRNVANRGLFTTDMQNIWEAIITLPNGDWIGVSQWEDEDYWVADCAFRANGMPLFSNGTGSRVTAVRTAAPEVAVVLDEKCCQYLESMNDEADYRSYNAQSGQWV